MERLRWGILGTGNIARQFAAGVLGSNRCTVAAVGSRSPENAREFCRGFGVAAIAGSYDDVLRSADCDAIYNALPNTMHHRWSIAAMRAGKHVLCEKPIACSAAEAEEMFDIARQTGRVLIEAFMYRAHPQTHKAIELIRAGTIGRVRTIRTSFCFRVRKVEGNIRFDPELAGGVLMDVGCYCTNFSRLMAGGEPTLVIAMAERHPSGVDEQITIAMRFDGGIHAGFVAAMGVQADNAAFVCGEDGYLKIPVPWKPLPGQGQVIFGQAANPRQDGDADLKSPPAAPPPVVHRIDDARPLYGIEADAFAAAVLDGATPFVTPADSLGNMLVLDTISRQIGQQ